MAYLTWMAGAVALAVFGAYGVAAWQARRSYRGLRFLSRRERQRLRRLRTAFLSGASALVAGLLAAGISYLLFA